MAKQNQPTPSEASTSEGAKNQKEPLVETEYGVSFDFNNNKYKFEDFAPGKIRINGAVLSQKEIIKNHDLLLQLVAGNSSLIKKI